LALTAARATAAAALAATTVTSSAALVFVTVVPAHLDLPSMSFLGRR
jgi:hypothetical protein